MSKALEGNGGVTQRPTRPSTCGFAQGSKLEHFPTAATTARRGFADNERSGDLQPNSPSAPSSSSLATGAAAAATATSLSSREARGLRDHGRSGDVKSPSADASFSSHGARSLRESIRNGDVQPANSPSAISSPSLQRERSLRESRRIGDLPQAKDLSINGSPTSQEPTSLRERSSRDSVRSGEVQQARTPNSPTVNAPPSDQGERTLRDTIRGGDVLLVKSPSCDASPSFQKPRGFRESIKVVDLQQVKSPAIPSSSRASPAAASPSIHRWASLGESVTSEGLHDNLAAAVSPPPSRAAPLTPSSTCTSLKSKLVAGHKLYGAFLVSFSTVVAEILGWAGYDFVVVDLGQLFPGDNFAALPVLQALASTGTPAIFRLPGDDPVLVNKALDMGPAGLMFSMIENEEAARNAVALCRYPPGGIRRGSRHVVSRASHYGLDASYIDRCEEELFVICQVETMEATDHIIEIAGVDGVDCIQMGGLDFGASLGDPYLDYNKEKILSRQGMVLLAGFATPESSPDSLFKRGYHLVSGAVDVVLLRDAAVADLRRNKPSLKI